MRNEANGRQCGPPLRVLVVEDYADAGETLAIVLRLFGHEVEVATDGPTALQRAQGRRHDVLVIDIGLPGDDGYAVAKRIRGLLSARPLLIAMTGNGQEEDYQRSSDEGFDHHLLKPFEACALQGLLEQFASRERAGGHGGAGFPKQPSEAEPALEEVRH